MSTSPLFWLRPLFICLTSQLYLWEYIWSSQQILISLFGFLQIKAHSSKFNLVFRSRSVLESLRKFGLALNLWKWQCSEGVVWFGFNGLFLSLFPDNSWCPCWTQGNCLWANVSHRPPTVDRRCWSLIRTTGRGGRPCGQSAGINFPEVSNLPYHLQLLCPTPRRCLQQ